MTRATVQCLMNIKTQMNGILSQTEQNVLFTYIDRLTQSVQNGANLNLFVVEHNLLRLRKELYETRRANIDQELRVEADRAKRSNIVDPLQRVQSFQNDLERVAATMETEGRAAVEKFGPVLEWMAPSRQLLGINWLWDVGRNYTDERGRMWVKAVAGKPDPNTPQFVLQAAREYNAWLDDALKQLRLGGAEAKKLKYRVPHMWDIGLVTADPQRFKSLLASRLDPAKHRDPVAAAEHIYTSLVKSLSETDPEFRIKSMREVFFGDIDAEIAMLEEFGMYSWADAFAHDMMDMTNKVVLVGEYGAKSFDTIRKMIDATKVDADNDAALLGDPELMTKLNAVTGTAKDMVTTLAGQWEGSSSITTANIFSGLRAFIGGFLLQKSVTYAGIDFTTTVGYNAEMAHKIAPGLVDASGRPLVQRNSALGNYLTAFMDNIARHKALLSEPQLRRTLDLVGTIEGVSTGFVLDRAGTAVPAPTQTVQSSKSEKFAKSGAGFANWSMRVQGGTVAMQQSQRSITLALGAHLATFSNEGVSWADFKGIEPELAMRMEEMGFDNEKWVLAVLNGQKARVGEFEFLVPKDVGARAMNEVAARRALMAFYKVESRQAVVAPDLWTRTQFAKRAGRAGSVTGEVTRSAMQFMSYQVAASRNLGLRMYRTKGFKGAARFVASAVVGGLVLAQIRQYLSGKPMYSINNPRGFAMWLAQGVNTSGVAWFAGSAIQAGVNTALTGAPLDSSNAGNYIGPAPEATATLLKTVLWDTARDFAGEGELSDTTKRNLLLVPARMVPVVNMPYFSHWYNKALYDMATDIDPKYGKMLQEGYEDRGAHGLVED